MGEYSCSPMIEQRVELLNSDVTFASSLLELFMIRDPQLTAAVFNGAFLLQDASRQTYTRTIGPKHCREELMGDVQRILGGPILCDQQPACEALFDTVKAIARD
jgi:hypothetical protein